METMRALQDGWDGPGSRAPTPQALTVADQIIAALATTHHLHPDTDLFVCPFDNQIYLARWYREGNTVCPEGRSIDIEADGSIAGKFGDWPHEQHPDNADDPVPVTEAVAWLGAETRPTDLLHTPNADKPPHRHSLPEGAAHPNIPPPDTGAGCP